MFSSSLQKTQCRWNLRNKEKQKSGRRDWIIIWEIYRKSNGLPNQQFHLKNYLQFKLHDGLKESDCFFTSCYRYIRNAALIFYIREVVFNEKKEDLQQLVEEVVDYYKNGGKINTAYKIAKKKISKWDTFICLKIRKWTNQWECLIDWLCNWYC